MPSLGASLRQEVGGRSRVNSRNYAENNKSQRILDKHTRPCILLGALTRNGRLSDFDSGSDPDADADPVGWAFEHLPRLALYYYPFNINKAEQPSSK